MYTVDSSTRKRLRRSDTIENTAGFSKSSTNVPQDHGVDVLAVTSAAYHTRQSPPMLPEQRPCLVAGTAAMKDAFFTTKIDIYSGSTAVELGCVALALLDTGSPHTSMFSHAMKSMKTAVAASVVCELRTPSRPLGVLGKSPPGQTNIVVYSSFTMACQTASLVVWAYVVPSEVMQHAVLLEHGSWMPSNGRSYRTLAPPLEDNRVMRNLTLSQQGLDGAVALVATSTPTETFHLLHAGVIGLLLSCDHQLFDITLVRRGYAPALAGS